MIVINTSFRRALWADALYACDGEWWNAYWFEVSSQFPGLCFTIDEKASHVYRLRRLPSVLGAPGLGKGCIHTGGNSGYQAINLAYLWGAKKIVLLGYDMKMKGRETHWHGDHPKEIRRASPYAAWRRDFEQLARDLEQEGVTVINATRDTALTCFRQASLSEALCS